MVPFLEVKSISKFFPGVQALNQVSLSIMPGEVRAIVGENGAGKSTLINIISGVYCSDCGELHIMGEKASINSPKQSSQNGISTVYQELSSVPHLTVGENIFLGREPRNKFGFVDWKKLFADSRDVLKEVGFDIDVRTKVGSLPISEQQMVEICRCVSAATKLIILDEPTSSLSRTEVLKLFNIIRRLKEKKIAVIYISHEINEVFEISDNITVFRNGELVATLKTSETNHSEIVRLMVGRNIAFDVVKPVSEKVIEKNHFVVKGIRNDKINNISMTVGKREIVGIVGIVGSGKTELARAIFGLDHADTERISLKGKDFGAKNPEQSIRNKIGFATESRRDDGLVLIHSILDNCCIVILNRIANKISLIRRKDEEELTNKMIEKLSIKTSGPNQIAANLSGGNQQKVVLSKWLLMEPDLLILDEPTRGIDVGTRQEFYKILEAVSCAGAGVIVLTSDIREALQVSDRVLIMRKGEIISELLPPDISYSHVLELMTGGNVDVTKGA